MEAKLFEMFDGDLTTPVLGILLEARVNRETFLLEVAGFERSEILLLVLNSMEIKTNPFEWDNQRMSVAHQYIFLNWAKLRNGEVVDVPFILGESDKKKEVADSNYFGNKFEPKNWFNEYEL